MTTATPRPHTTVPDQRYRTGILSTIARTPLIELDRLFVGERVRVLAKLEMMNPGGSIKDRVALGLIEDGLANGTLVPGLSTVVESSSGNLGIGLAQVCRYYDLSFVCVVDPRTNVMNIDIMRAYGAVVEMVDQPDPATGEFLARRIQRVKELVVSIPGAYWPNQYENEVNPRTHERTMSEIVTQVGGPIDAVFCATSTCGTVRGCQSYLRAAGLDTQVVAVDASGSAIFGSACGARHLPGHGASFRPPLYTPEMADQIVLVDDVDSVRACRDLRDREAIMAGASSGAVIAAVERLLPTLSPGATVVAILADSGERYLSSVYNDDWVRRELTGNTTC